MEKIYNKLQKTKQDFIINKIINKNDKEKLTKIKNIHERENISRLAKDFYHQADVEIFYRNDPSQAGLLYDMFIDVALDDIIMEGRANLKNSNCDKAIELYNELIDLNYVRAKYDLGDVYLFDENYKDINKGIMLHKEAINEKYIASHGSLGIYYLLNNEKESAEYHINMLIDSDQPLYMLEFLEKAYKYHINDLIDRIINKMNIKQYLTLLTEIIDFCLTYEYDPKEYIDIILKKKNIYSNISLIDIYLKHDKIDEAKELTKNIGFSYYDLFIEKYLKNGYIAEAINYTREMIENDECERLSNIVGHFLNTKPNPLLDYYPNKIIIEILDRYEKHILEYNYDSVDELLCIYIDNYLSDKANALFDKTLKDNKYRYTVSLLKICLLYNDIDKANQVYHKIIADKSYSEMISLVDYFLDIKVEDNINVLTDIIQNAKDKYYPAKLVSLYLKYYYDQKAYIITKELMKAYQYCYEQVYDCSFIYTLINSYLDNYRVEEVHDISLYVLKTSKNRFHLQKLYYAQGYENEFKNLLKEAV